MMPGVTYELFCNRMDLFACRKDQVFARFINQQWDQNTKKLRYIDLTLKDSKKAVWKISTQL